MPSSSGVAVVTGAASGIGKAVAGELAGRGWQVAGLDVQPVTGCAWSAQVDVTSADEVEQAVSRLEETLGPVSAAVSVAGHYEMFPVAEISPERWERMLRVHLGGLLHLCRAVLPSMRRERRGSIVAIASELAVGGGDGDAHYAAAKGAVLGLARSLAAETASTGVRVNVVAPGPTDTPMLATDSPWRAGDYLETLPLRRLVSPEEVAFCVGFLTDEAQFCVGDVLNPNAGAVI